MRLTRVQPSLCVRAAEVRAKVLRVDHEAGKLSLCLKPSYFEDESGSDAADGDGAGEDGRDLDEILAEELDAQQQQQQQRAAAQVRQTLR